MLCGTGANGKSALLTLMRNVFGTYAEELPDYASRATDASVKHRVENIQELLKSAPFDQDTWDRHGHGDVAVRSTSVRDSA